jgi:hypothetical protein
LNVWRGDPVTTEILDISALSQMHSEHGRPRSEKAIRHDIERKLIPFRRKGSRIFFLRSEILEFWRGLDGCSVEEALRRARGEAP